MPREMILLIVRVVAVFIYSLLWGSALVVVVLRSKMTKWEIGFVCLALTFPHPLVCYTIYAM